MCMALNIKALIPSPKHEGVTPPQFETTSQTGTGTGKEFDINQGSREKAMDAWKQIQNKIILKKDKSQLLDVL